MISTWSPPESLAWQKGFRLGSGMIWRFLGLWLLVGSLLLLVSVCGVLVVVIGGTLWLFASLAAAVISLARFKLTPHLAVRTLFDCGRWSDHSACAAHSPLACLLVACC